MVSSRDFPDSQSFTKFALLPISPLVTSTFLHMYIFGFVRFGLSTNQNLLFFFFSGYLLVLYIPCINEIVRYLSFSS